MDVAQALVALRALKRHAGHGMWTEPPLLDMLPAPAFEPIQRTFDLLVPDRSALVAYVIEDDRSRIHTSIIAVKDDGDITRAATHRAIADLVPEADVRARLAKRLQARARCGRGAVRQAVDRAVPRAQHADRRC